MVYDLIILGAGPAGITASVYAARKRMDFLVITGDIGGQTALSGDIENYTGYQFITGPELVSKFEEHMRGYGTKLKEGETVRSVEKRDGIVHIKTDNGEYQAKTVIIATGKRVRELGVPGEKEYKNRGLTYCATCDAPLFSGKDVAIIGGGNSALDAALQLIKIVPKIYIINIASEVTGDSIMSEKVIASDKVTVLNKHRVTAILGDKMVSGIEVSEVDDPGGASKKIDVKGVFVEVGLVPNADFISGVEKNEFGEIKVDSYNRTREPGIFAAGDVTDVPEKQIIIAAGDGSKAALAAFNYLARSK